MAHRRMQALPTGPVVIFDGLPRYRTTPQIAIRASGRENDGEIKGNLHLKKCALCRQIKSF